MNYNLLKKLVEDVCMRHKLHAEGVDVNIERDFRTGELSRIVVTEKRYAPDRIVTIEINGEEEKHED